MQILGFCFAGIFSMCGACVCCKIRVRFLVGTSMDPKSFILSIYIVICVDDDALNHYKTAMKLKIVDPEYSPLIVELCT